MQKHLAARVIIESLIIAEIIGIIQIPKKKDQKSWYKPNYILFTYLHQRTVSKRFIVVLCGCGFLNKNKSILTFFLSVFPKLSTINFFICIKVFRLRDTYQSYRNSNGSRGFFIPAKHVQPIKCRRGNRLPYKERSGITCVGRGFETQTSLTVKRAAALILLSHLIGEKVFHGTADSSTAQECPPHSSGKDVLTSF